HDAAAGDIEPGGLAGGELAVAEQAAIERREGPLAGGLVIELLVREAHPPRLAIDFHLVALYLPHPRRAQDAEAAFEPIDLLTDHLKPPPGGHRSEGRLELLCQSQRQPCNPHEQDDRTYLLHDGAPRASRLFPAFLEVTRRAALRQGNPAIPL